MAHSSQTCRTGSYIRKQQCVGLTSAGHVTASECQHKCCEDATCSVWQWHESTGCSIGDSDSCSADTWLEADVDAHDSGWHGQLIERHRGALSPYGDRPFRLVHLGAGHGFGYTNADATALVEDEKMLLAMWLHNPSREAAKAIILAHLEVQGFFSDIAAAIKRAAQRLAMAVCLGALELGKVIVSIGGAIISGLANFLIMALEAAIKAMGPRFFEIMNLEISGGFDVMSGGDVAFGFALDMWLANIRIDFSFKIEFNIGKIVMSLFNKLKDSLASIF